MSHPHLNATTLDITRQLIERESVTPLDAGCQNFIADYLQALGFETEHMDFADTQNIWSLRHSSSSVNGPCFVFAGHTDVVPAGNLSDWHTPPFQATLKDGYLYGRGAADMKGSLAAMLTATKRFVEDYPQHQGSIGFLITSDEEGPFINGTIKVVEVLRQRRQPIDYCLVGEPSSSHMLGDVVKIGRRGSLSASIIIKGKQGHVAYPHLADNAIHSACSLISQLNHIEWDQGNAFFPPTSLQITDFHSGVAGNVVPGEAKIALNFRYSTEQTHIKLQTKVEQLLKRHCQGYQIDWKLNGEPFLTQSKTLIQAVSHAVQQVCAIQPALETSGGTSDGRFIAKMGAEVVELGPVNQSIHQVNERVKIDDLARLSHLYYELLKYLLI